MYSTIELHKAGLQMHGLAVWVFQINGTVLVLVFVDVTQMSAKLQTKSHSN